MGSDLGKGFIVILLSCDLHMIRQSVCSKNKTLVAIFNIKVMK